MDIQLKNEYLTNFKVKTVPLFKQGFRSLYDTTLKNTKNKKNLLKEFQATLTNIPQWNSVIVDNEYDRFVKGSHCDWMGNLILAVFKATTKELLIFKNCDEDVDVVVPSAKIFIHSCYIEIARVLWRKPQLMYHKYTGTKASMNEDDLDQAIKNSIDITLNKYLPFEKIISKFVNSDSDKSSQNNTPLNTPRDSEKSNEDILLNSNTEDTHDTNDTHDEDETQSLVENTIESPHTSLEQEPNTINDIKYIDIDKKNNYVSQSRITHQPKKESDMEVHSNVKQIELEGGDPDCSSVDETSDDDDEDNESRNDGEIVDVENHIDGVMDEDFHQQILQTTIGNEIEEEDPDNYTDIDNKTNLENTNDIIETPFPQSIPMDPPMEQPMNQPMIQPMEQSMEQSMDQPMIQPMDPLMEQPMIQSMDQQPMIQSMDPPMDQPMIQPMDPPMEQPMIQSMDPPMDQPMVQPMDPPMVQQMVQPMDPPMVQPMVQQRELFTSPQASPRETSYSTEPTSTIKETIQTQDSHWINDEVNRSIKEINLRTKEHKNKEKIKKHLGLDIDSSTLKQNYKQIRNQLLLENSKRWG
jgi:hypothetical protein